MAWVQISFVVDDISVGALSDVLEGLLAQAVTIENAGADEFYDAAWPSTPDWQKVEVTALFDAAVESQAVIDFVNTQLSSQTEIPTTVQKLQDQDWERVWLNKFEPVKVGDSLWICPSWCSPVAPNERNVFLDPGLAFGTGTHPTTRLCLQWLAGQNLNGQTVLDYGSGSGILAIAAILCGADRADAVDVDPLAVTAASENARRNRVGDKLSSYFPNELPDDQYSIVIANILADVIIELKTTLLGHLADNGTVLLTGILDSQVDRVKREYAQAIEFKVCAREQWCLLVGRAVQS